MAQRIVGLDIGTSAVRAVELSVVEGQKPILEAFGQVGLPHGVVVDGEVKDRSAVAQALRRLWQEGEFREKQVRLGIAGLRAITRELDMPVIPPDELDGAVRFRADEVVPFPIERTAISTRVIAQFTNADNEASIRVLVAAAHLDLVDSIVGAVEDAGLEPVAIDLNTAALVRTIYDPSTDGPEAVVSVGAGLTLVVVHERGALQFVRTIDLGGDSTTRSIASALDLPENDAETVKRSLGIDPNLDSRARSAASQAVAELVTEITNSIRFYAAQPGRKPVARLLVTGGGAQTDGFLQDLQRASTVPVVLASPLSRTDMSRLPITPDQAASIDPTLAVPVGLALPEMAGRPFNLLPAEVTTRAAERKVRRGLLVGAGAIVVLLIGLSAWRVSAVNSAKSHVASLTSDIQVIKTVQIPKYDKAVELRSSVAALEKQPIPVLSGEVDWLVVLNQISSLQPTNAFLSSISMTAMPPVAPAAPPASKGGTASKSTTIPVPTASETIANVATNVTVPNLTSVTSWGQSMNSGTILIDVLPNGTLAPGPSGVTFSASISVSGLAQSQRIAQYEEPVP